MKPWMWVLLFLLLAALTPPPAHAAANGAPVWTNTYNGTGNSEDRPSAIVVDKIGNVIVTGFSNDTNGVSDYLTVAYSSAGVPLWTNRYNGLGHGDDHAIALALDKSGNVFVAGSSYASGSGYDYATVAYSNSGAPMWTNRFNGLGSSDDIAHALAVDGSGNVIVTGESTSQQGSYDFVTIKYSNAGVPLWTNCYNGPVSSNDSAYCLAVDNSDNIYVAGISYGGDMYAGGSDYDYTTIKYSSEGVPLWTNRYNGPADYIDWVSAIAVGSNGSVFVTGWSVRQVTYNDFATIAYSSEGVPLWTNRFNGRGNSFDSAYAIVVNGDGDIYVAGTSDNGFGDYDYAMVKYSNAGLPLWTNYYGGPVGNYGNYEVATSIALDAAGNIIVTGLSTDSGIPDFATVAYSSAGVPLWTNRYNGSGNNGDNAAGIAIDGSGNVYVTGESIGNGSNYDFVTIKYAAMLTLTQTAADNGQFRFQFNADSNLTYAVEFRDALSSSNWVTLTNIAALPAATNLVLTNTVTNDARFFRVRTP